MSTLTDLREAYRAVKAVQKAIKQAQTNTSRDVQEGVLIIASENADKALKAIERVAKKLKP